MRVKFSRTTPIRSRVVSEKLFPMIEIPYLSQVSATKHELHVVGYLTAYLALHPLGFLCRYISPPDLQFDSLVGL